MKTPLTYGFGLFLGGALVMLLCYLLGYHNDLARFQTGQTFAMVAGISVMVVALVLGMKAVRSESPTQSLSYGRAVGTGTLISTFSGVMSAVFTYVYGTLINPEYHQLMYEFQVSKVAEQMTSSQIEQAEPMMRFFTGPLWIAIAQVVFSPIMGVIVSLIVALFMKRPPKDTPPAVPAA